MYSCQAVTIEHYLDAVRDGSSLAPVLLTIRAA